MKKQNEAGYRLALKHIIRNAELLLAVAEAADRFCNGATLSLSDEKIEPHFANVHHKRFAALNKALRELAEGRQ